MCAVATLLAALAAPLHAQEVDDLTTLDRLIDRADPRAVPVVQRWLTELASRPLEQDDLLRVYVAIDGIRVFHLEEAGPLLVAIYNRPETADDASLAGKVVHAAANFRTPEARGFQAQLMRDEKLSPSQRVLLAAVLADAGDAEAERFVLEWFEPIARGLDDGGATDFAVYEALPWISTPTFRAALEAMVPRLGPQGAEHATRLIAMRDAAAMPIDEQHALIAEASRDHGDAARAYVALLSIARRGGVGDIARLERTPLGKDGVLAKDTFVESARKRALRDLRGRHWGELADAPDAAYE